MRRFPLLLTLVLLVPVPARASGVIPEAVPDLPVAGPEAPRGGGLITHPAAPATPSPKVVDGAVADWTGESSRLAGTALYSRGEYVYQDYMFDDHGADGGDSAQYASILDPLAEAEPRTYRLDALAQALGEEFGAPSPPATTESYGDAAYPAGAGRQADLEEVRVAADASRVYLMARTSVMSAAPRTALLLLFATAAGAPPGSAVPFGAGVSTDVADLAVYVSASEARYADLGTGASGTLSSVGGAVGFGPAGFTNAVEVSVPRSLVERPDGRVTLAAAAGIGAPGGLDPAAGGSGIFNLAFRFDEPVRVWMDKRQALTLGSGAIDDFFTSIEIGKLMAGYSESFEPRPGYYERVFESTTPGLAVESGTQGRFQHYGLLIPHGYRTGSANPATFWLHWRGGKAHSAAAWVPRIFRHLGDDRGNIIISPSARGTSTWYLGKGHADFLEVWDDAMASFPIDRDRVYVSGYSMGGWGSWFLGLVYPDRFAAAFPIVGPPTCGAWAGAGPAVGVEECRSPGQTNEDENANKLLTFPIVENAINLPYVIFQGTNDELVPVSGVTRQAVRLAELGYRYREYVFPGYEHYTFAIMDEWVEGARYFDQFRRDPNPRSVSYSITPGMEDVAETVQTNGTPFDFHFDGAYWTSELEVYDPARRASFDAQTYGRGGTSELQLPEVGAVSPLGHSTPYVMHGMRWARGGTIPAANRFSVKMINLTHATLDLARMGIATTARITAQAAMGQPATLALRGSWTSPPVVLLDGAEVASSYVAGVLSFAIPFGISLIEILAN